VTAVHTKIRNFRKDTLLKLSTARVKEYCAFFVGNVNASALEKTRMAETVPDLGKSAFRAMLQYEIRAITRACGSMRSMKIFDPDL
jgi:hypothetical protein